MTPIDRRAFLCQSSVTAGLAALPAWIARAFARQDPADAPPPVLRSALDRAAAGGKPVLVFVVPANPDLVEERGGRFGALLNHGGDGVLLDVALCELACAKIAEVEQVLGTRIADEPWLLVIEPPGNTNQRQVVGVAPPAQAPDGPVFGPEFDARVGRETEALGAALHEVLAGDRGRLADRADRVRATLGADVPAALERFFAGGAPPADAMLVQAAAVVRMAAQAPRVAGDRDRLLGQLASAAKRVLVEPQVPGSRWAKNTGCGVAFEGEAQQAMIACGMGYVPEICARFLYFFTQ